MHAETHPESENRTDLLDALDQALACALDETALSEVLGEFTASLENLPREEANRAERICERHGQRIQNLLQEGRP